MASESIHIVCYSLKSRSKTSPDYCGISTHMILKEPVLLCYEAISVSHFTLHNVNANLPLAERTTHTHTHN